MKQMMVNQFIIIMHFPYPSVSNAHELHLNYTDTSKSSSASKGDGGTTVSLQILRNLSNFREIPCTKYTIIYDHSALTNVFLSPQDLVSCDNAR